MLWGKDAQRYAHFFNMPNQLVLTAPHPAAEAYSGGKAGYFGCKHFSKPMSFWRGTDAIQYVGNQYAGAVQSRLSYTIFEPWQRSNSPTTSRRRRCTDLTSTLRLRPLTARPPSSTRRSIGDKDVKEAAGLPKHFQEVYHIDYAVAIKVKGGGLTTRLGLNTICLQQ